MTGFLDCLVALLVSGMLNVFIASRIKVGMCEEETRFLQRVFWWTLALRYVLATMLNLYGGDSAFGGMFWGDSSTYDEGGYGLALVWQGDAVGAPSFTAAVGRFGFYYFVGAIYFVFGRNHLLVQFLNGTIGALTVLVMHALAVRLFGALVARRVAILMAFFPGMVFWSAGMYKDPAVLLCIVVSMYAVVRLREAVSPAMLMLFFWAVLALLTLRFYIAYFVVFATLSTFVFSRRGSLLQRIFSYGLLVGALALVFTVGVRQEALEKQRAYVTLEQVQWARDDQATRSGSGFGLEYDVTTPAGALAALPTGLLYLLFAPFPWAVLGIRQALTVPETLVWYALIPAFIGGLVHAIRRQLTDILPILVFGMTLTLAYALTQGNIGTAYRQRSQVTMFFFLFMGVGLVERANQRALRASKHVRTPALPR